MNVENLPPQIDLLRSSSSNDVLGSDIRPHGSSTSPRATAASEQLRLLKTTVINSQPQDFIVTKGQTYRVNRSPLGISMRGKKTHLNGDLTQFSSSPTDSAETAKIKMLLKALDEANRKICDQNNDIQTLQHNEAKYQKRINSLETKCGEELTIFPDVLAIPTAGPLSRGDSNSSSTPSEDSKCGDTPSRHRNKLQNALRNEKELKVRTFSPALSHLHPYDYEISDSKLRSYSEDTSDSLFGTPLMSNQSTPSSVEDQINLLRSSHDVVLPADVSEEDGGRTDIDHSPIKTDPEVHLDNMIMMDNALKDSGPTKMRIPSSKSALAARLGMSAKDRRSKDRDHSRSNINSNNSNIRKLKSSPHLAVESAVNDSSGIAPYVWLRPEPDAVSQACTLFIAHDNPQLGKTIADAISEGMELMIESKSQDKKIAFVLAKIVYSGPVEKVLISEGTSTSAASKTLPRGSQCLVCKDLRAFDFELSRDCETRVKGVIAEVNMCKEHLPERCTIDISTKSKLMTFFRSCDARVDVILAPHHTQTWYPYWEYGSEPSAAVANGTQPGVGARKMAPQFRSKGIGYLRLGDDMSRFGTSFLSCDGFDTFMDEGKGGVEEKQSSTSYLQPGAGQDPLLGRHNQGGTSSQSGTDSVEVTQICTDQQLSEVVSSLQLSDFKWSERVACISKICDYLTKQSSLESEAAVTIEDVAKCLIHQLLSQKNPLVLKEATRCTGIVGLHFSKQKIDREANTFAETWNDLFIMCVHNLRHANRGVSEAAKASLSGLVGSSVVNLNTVGANMKDLIAGPLRPGSTNHMVVNAPNTARVLQWTAAILEDYTKRICQSKSHAAEVQVVTFTGICTCESPHGYTYTNHDLEINPIVAIAHGVVPLLNNKDVSVREAAVTVSAQLFSLDILHCGRVQKFNLNTHSVSESLEDLDPSVAGSLLPLPRDIDSLMQALSDKCADLLESFVEKKLQAKVAQRSIEYVNKLYSNNKNKMSNSDVSQDNGSPSTTGESPPTGVLKKSLSNLNNTKHKRQRKIRRTSSSNSAPDEGSHGPPSSTQTDPLADMLFEVNLSLKSPPNDDDSWQRFATISRESPDFFASMRSTAKRENMSVGTLLGRVLPFTEETSSNDQSKVQSSGEDSGLFDIPEMKVLRASAIAIRSMIRVKMADENDFKQAEDVMKQLVSFTAAVDLRAGATEKTSMQVLESLKL
mmetsp:Transcript_1871/g.3549  ORF Transcript_1871/g.3549 Transcript_1871/m.3549 type:complete len:1203 (-) Transcript_1871:168-3776(-)